MLVAFSGGPDSRALLSLLAGLSSAYPLRIAAAYLDHGLRPPAELREELEFVRRCCAEAGVELTVGRISPGVLAARARRRRCGLEEAARTARYRFLRRTLRETGCSYLALGHNLDDHVETLVMRFFQGAGTAGLRGIRRSRGVLLRPLREAGRSEIGRWLRERGLEYRLDSSNQDLSILRNAVRHRLLPVAEELFPGYRGALQRLSRSMREITSLLRSEAQGRLHWRPEPGIGLEPGAGTATEAQRGGWSIDREEFFRAPYLLRLQSLYGQIDRWGPAFRRVPQRFFAILRDPRGQRGGGVLLAGHGMILRSRGGRLFLERDIVRGGKKGYFIRVPGGSAALVAEAGLRFVFLDQDALAKPDSRGAGLGTQPAGRVGGGTRAVAESLVFRSVQAGDRIWTGRAHRPVRKLLGDWKIPCSERWKVPVVDSGRGILAVLGGPLGYLDRFDPGLPGELRSALRRAVERG